MTPIHKVRLHYHRRYNWQLWWREYKEAAKLLLLAIVTFAVIVLGEGWMREYIARITVEHQHVSLLLDVRKLQVMGEPGYTLTDWQEGTEAMGP